MTCPDCPDTFLPKAAKRQVEIDHNMQAGLEELEKCSLRDNLSGKKRRVTQELANWGRVQNYLDTVAPEEVLAASETCLGPFERTVTSLGGKPCRQQVCGARVLNLACKFNIVIDDDQITMPPPTT